MSKIITRSIFTEKRAESRSWQSYLGSGVAHVVLAAALFYVTFPAIQQVVTPAEHVSLIAPVLPQYKPKVLPEPVVHQRVILKEPVKPILPPPRKFVPPPVVKPPEVKPLQVAKAPEIKAPTVQHAPEVKIEAPAPPKPPIRTGVFDSQELAKGPKAPNQVKVGGFGDPNGVHPSENAQPGKLVAAKIGAFDMPNGSGQGGGGGKSANGGVKAAGFGSLGDPSGVPGGTGTHGSIRTGAFGDSAVQRPTQIAQVQTQPATTPVEVLFKPKPNYSEEARKLGLEGQVIVDVVFGADGTIHVVRIEHGLGHGLDEAAEQAARAVRFKPMTRNGAPVDARGSLTITFQST